MIGPCQRALQAMQAVDFYNSNVLKVRIHAGLSSERRTEPYHYPYYTKHTPTQEQLLWSNSSLDLIQVEVADSLAAGVSNPSLRREYGSHGSIDVASSYTGPVPGMMMTDQRSPGPSEYLRPKLDCLPSNADVQSSLSSFHTCDADRRLVTESPKLKIKFQRLFGGQSSDTVIKSLRTHSSLDNSNSPLSTSCSSYDGTGVSSTVFTDASVVVSGRRRCFAHYDVLSLSANLGYAARVKSLLLSRRRNISTGASAANSANIQAHTPDSDEDDGDGKRNHLIQSCPFFRNEIGGEGVHEVSLRILTSPVCSVQSPLHRPYLAYGLSILEFPQGETHWKHGTCPFQSNGCHIESRDTGALYFRKYFYKQEHQNWLGLDESLGPVAISLKREKVKEFSQECQQMYRYRLLIRTSELHTLRGSILEDAIPHLKPSSSNSKNLNAKEVLEYVAPEVQLNCLRLGVSSTAAQDQILKLDEQALTSTYKVGVMYCKAGQRSEEDMYNNEEAGPALNEFLDIIGRRVRLKGFEQYRAGLDNKTDSTGLYSVYSEHQGCQIMFHVSPLLPFTPHNRQQLLRKRHIGNDIVTVVFQEPGSLPFTPRTIRSKFQHVFIVVKVSNPNTDHTQYSVAVSRSKGVSLFGPPIPQSATFNRCKEFRDFLLAKIINGENAAHRSEKFVSMATRTRQEYLKELIQNFSTSTSIETTQKFSIQLFSSKKKERWRPRIIPDSLQRGALCWQVYLSDSKSGALIPCTLAISADSFVLIEETSQDVMFVSPTQSVLGWASSTNSSLQVYHHQGEAARILMREGGDRDELMEVVVRLGAVTPGSTAQELTLKRNGLGQLGFHVQPDGVVIEVETGGLAYQAGLRQGCRLVEICKVAVSTLSHDQMVDLLKTSNLVTLTIIPALSDGTARSGCTLVNCPYNAMRFESEYENLNTLLNEDVGVGKLTCTPVNNKSTALQQAPLSSAQRKRYDRSFSPLRSSNSSGYGTGSSSHSLGADNRFLLEINDHTNPNQNNMVIEKTISLPSNAGSPSTDGFFSVQNEDELFIASPLLHHKSKDGNSCGSGSPRSRETGEARLRSGATARNVAYNRHSANLSSTLQQNLIRLISPDYTSESEITGGKDDSSSNSESKSSGNEENRSEVIVTTARPVSVSTSHNTDNSKLHKEERVTDSQPLPIDPQKTSTPLLPLPDGTAVDWPSLVNTATRALIQVNGPGNSASNLGKWADDIAGRLGLDTSDNHVSSKRLASLQKYISQLESRLSRETRKRLTLEEEVRGLREENKRLLEESQNALQQLKRFTEWFFQTIDKQ